MRTFLFVLLALCLFSSCQIFGGKKVRGNGNVTTSQISTGNFENIEAGGAVLVYVQQASTPSVQIETDENLIQYLEVKTEGNTLHIQTKSGFNLDPSKDVIVRVAAPQFESLEVSGASKLFGQGTLTGDDVKVSGSGASEIQLDVDVSKLQADLSGACTLKLRGKATNFETEASGGSNIMCLELTAENASLDLSGASNAKVTANKELRIDASGASDVEYRGNPSINQKSSGASSVKKIG